MPKTIFLIRHGQSTFNAHYEATGEDPGHFDAPLTDLGHAQAAQVRDDLAGTPVDLAVCSPLTRAIQTTLGIFGERGVPVHVTHHHRERLESSCDVGRSPVLLREHFPGLVFDHLDDPWWHHDPDMSGPFVIEPLGVFEKRVEEFAEWISARPEANVAVIGHGTFFHALTGRWLRNCEVMEWRPGPSRATA